MTLPGWRSHAAPEYTSYARQLVSHEYAIAETFEEVVSEAMARRGGDAFTRRIQRIQDELHPRKLIMSQHQYDDILQLGKDIETRKARKEQMKAERFIIKPGGQVHKGQRAVALGEVAPVGSREARRKAAREAARVAKKGKRRCPR